MKHSPRRSSSKSQRRFRDLWQGFKRERTPRPSQYSVELLEQRQMLASDLGQDVPAEVALDGAEGEQVAEQDLVAFAKALTDAGVTFFGAAWCSHCTDQKQLFEDGAHFLPFVEVTNPDRTLNQIGIDEGITTFPTWEFQDDSRVEGALSLEEISQRSGIAIPTSFNPFIAPIDDSTVLDGSPLVLAIDGYDPNQDQLTYTVSSDNPNFSVELLQNNRSMSIDTGNYGIMTFQLFEGLVSRVTDEIIGIADDGTYDGVVCHRVIDGFVLQCGDPTGTGFGDPSIPDFDDQFHLDLQHNRTGLLSMAKSGDDTNSSQFFITEGATRHLDFNHSIFGVLLEGEDVREAISDVPTDASDRPLIDVTMETVNVFTDLENAAMMIKADGVTIGETATITVTATDVDGEQFTETFTVTADEDTFNGGPFLSDIPAISTTVNTAAVFQLEANDAEGDPVIFDAVRQGSVDYTFDVDSASGQVTVTPPTDFVGEMEIQVRVRAASGSDTSDTFDSQLVTIQVGPAAPSMLDLLPGSDSGFSDTDDLTNATPVEFEISGVISGAIVTLELADGTALSQGTATGNTITLAASTLASMGDGDYTLRATQTVDGITSEVSSGLTITVDTTAPDAFTSTPNAAAVANSLYEYDAENPEEGTTGFAYSLQNAPNGATIDPATGVVSWTPSTNDIGDVSFNVAATDAAGNSTSQAVNVTVAQVDAVVNIFLQAATLDGTPITEVAGGSQFLLQAFVQDIRSFPENAEGVFAAYMDILFDSSLATAVMDSINFATEYTVAQSGDIDTDGLINDAGAAAASIAPLGPDARLLFSVVIQANNILNDSEVLTFTTEAADSPGTDVLVYGENTSVPLEDVVFGQTSLTITGDAILVDDIFNVDEDSLDNPLDVFLNDNLTGLGDVTISDVSMLSGNGTIEIATDGKSVIYTPAADFFGAETFTYTIEIGDQTATASVQVQVANVNDPPIAEDDDNVNVNQDSTDNFIDVQINDTSDPDPLEALEITNVSSSSQGANITIAPNGTHLLYTPAAGFVGTDTFTYTLEDPGGLTDTATVTVRVNEINDAPTAVDDDLDVSEDSLDNVLDVLDNDTDPEDDALTITTVGPASEGGTVEISSDDQTLVYTPTPDFFGTETFTYTVTDGGLTSTATVTVTVNNVNDAPTANDDHHDDNSDLTVSKDTGPHTLDVLANDSSDPDPSEILNIIGVTQGSEGGSLSISDDDMSVVYTPATDFVGTETFTYTIEDEGGLTDTATVTVQVLDFVPRTLSGMVPFEGDMGVGGAMLLLEGTDMFGEFVTMTTTTDAEGRYAFTDVAPGDYVVKSQEPELFLFDEATELMIASTFEDGDSMSNDFDDSMRVPLYIGVGDYLASTPREYIIAAIDTDDGSQWYSLTSGWDNVDDVQIDMEADFSELTITVTTKDGTQMQASSTTLAQDGVHLLGSEGTAHLLRIPGKFDDFAFEELQNSAAGAGEGEAGGANGAEGEAEGEASLAASSSDDGSGQGTGDVPALDAEGEAPPVAILSGSPTTASSTPSSSSNRTTNTPLTESIDVVADTTSGNTNDAFSLLLDSDSDSTAAEDEEAANEETNVDLIMTELGSTTTNDRLTTAVEKSAAESDADSEDFEGSVDALLSDEDFMSIV